MRRYTSDHLGLGRYTSDHMDTMSNMQQENTEMKNKMKELETELAGARAQVVTTENKLRNVNLERDKDRVQWDRSDIYVNK